MSDMIRILCGSISVSYDLWLPYSSGCLISYANRNVNTDHIKWLEPLYRWLPDDELILRLSDCDVLCLTSYVWNHEYNLRVIGIFKEINPDGIAIMGGPEIPNDPNDHAIFATERPVVDVFVAGPGELVFADIVANIRHPYRTWTQCFGNGWTNVSGRLSQVPAEQMPNPYIDGIFNSIVAKEERIKASFETNRGCPYKCAFCDWGGQANNKVIKIPMEQVRDAIDWIYDRPNITEIEILDANFGMHRRDLETVRYMMEAKNRTGNNPTVSYSGLVKNGSPHLPEIIRIIHNHLGAERRHLKLSFQTHSKDTLRTVLRDNIDNARLLSIIEDLNKDGIDVSSEMIIGLPGETAESWLQSQGTDYQNGIRFMRTYILTLVRNTRLYERDYRKEHGISSKKILIPYEFKRFNKLMLISDPSLSISPEGGFESSEIIHRCNSFDLNELTLMFRYFWYYHNLINSKAFTNAIAYLYSKGVRIEDQIKLFISKMQPGGLFDKMGSKQDSIISDIYRDEEQTILTRYSSYRFFSGSLRTDDLYQLANNRYLAAREFCEIFDANDALQNAVMSDISCWIDLSSGPKVFNKLLGMGSSIRL